MISFYRGRAGGGTRPDRLAALAGVADLGLAALTARLRDDARVGAVPLALRLETRLADRFDALTLRERQICARSLVGMTAGQIAADLGIRPGTVMTYRKRAYARYGFGRATDFLGALVH